MDDQQTHEEFLALSQAAYVWEATVYTIIFLGCMVLTALTLYFAPLSIWWLIGWAAEGALCVGVGWLALSAWKDAARRGNYPD